MIRARAGWRKPPPCGESWGSLGGGSWVTSADRPPTAEWVRVEHGVTDDRAPDGRLAVPPFPDGAGPPGPAAALPTVRPRRRLVAAQPDRHDGGVHDRLQQHARVRG